MVSAAFVAFAVFLLNDAVDWGTDLRSPGQRLRAPQVGIGKASLLVGGWGFLGLAVWAASRLSRAAILDVGIAALAGLVYAIWGKRLLWVGFVAHAAGVGALAALASRAGSVVVPVAALSGLVVWAWLGWFGRAHDDRDADAAEGLRTPATAWTLPRFARIRHKLTWLTVGLFCAAAMQRPEWWPWAAVSLVRLAPVGRHGAWRPRALAVAALIGEAASATVRDWM